MAIRKPKNQVPTINLEYTPYTTPDGRSPQREFANAIASGAKVILFLAGIRSGKTYSGIMECLKQIYTYKKEPALGWIISPTYPMSLVPERLFKKLSQTPKGSLIAHEKKGERAFYMRAPRGMKELYRVEFKSADDPDRLRGASIAWAMMDEAAMMKSETFDILLGRVLDSNGVLILTTTPRGKNWVFHDVYQRSLHDPRYVVIRAKTSDNVYLDAEDVKGLEERHAAKSDALFRQEMEGEFCDFEGLVFNHFRADTHVVKDRDIDQKVPVICGIDWGYNDPFVCVFVAKIDGVWHVVDEYYKSRTLLADHAAYIRNHRLFPQISRFWADPSSPQNRREFAALGIKTLPARRPDGASKTVGWPEVRARLINNLFSQRLRSPWNIKEISPGLVFFDTVMHGRREVEALCYEQQSAIIEDPKSGKAVVRVIDRDGREVDRNASEKIQDKDNHFVDALGYALFSEVKTYGTVYAHYKDENTGAVIQQKNTDPQIITDEWIAFREGENAKARRKAKFFGNMSDFGEPFTQFGV